MLKYIITDVRSIVCEGDYAAYAHSSSGCVKNALSCRVHSGIACVAFNLCLNKYIIFFYKRMMSTLHFRVYTSQDVTGVELGE